MGVEVAGADGNEGPLVMTGEDEGGAADVELGALLIRGWVGPVLSPAPWRAAMRSLIDNGRAGAVSSVEEEGLRVINRMSDVSGGGGRRGR